MTRSRKQSAAEFLRRMFQRNGCVRLPDVARRRRENQLYKKGYEVRLVAMSAEELEQATRAAVQKGFTPGRPFQKRGRFVLPLYGKEAVERFLRMAGGLKGRSRPVHPTARQFTKRSRGASGSATKGRKAGRDENRNEAAAEQGARLNDSGILS